MRSSRSYAEEQAFDPRTIAIEIQNDQVKGIELKHQFYYKGVLIFQANVETNLTRKKKAKKPMRFLVLGETESNPEIITARATGILQTVVGLDLAGAFTKVPDGQMQWSSGLQLKWQVTQTQRGGGAGWARDELFKNRKAYCRRICDLFSGRSNTEVTWEEVDWDAIKDIVDMNEKFRDQFEGFKINPPAGMQVSSGGALEPKKKNTDTQQETDNFETIVIEDSESDKSADDDDEFMQDDAATPMEIVDLTHSDTPTNIPTDARTDIPTNAPIDTHQEEPKPFVADKFNYINRRVSQLVVIIETDCFPLTVTLIQEFVAILNTTYPWHLLTAQAIEGYRAGRNSKDCRLQDWPPFREWWEIAEKGPQPGAACLSETV